MPSVRRLLSLPLGLHHPLQTHPLPNLAARLRIPETLQQLKEDMAPHQATRAPVNTVQHL